MNIFESIDKDILVLSGLATAIIFTFIGLIKNNEKYSLRIVGVMLVVSLSIMAESVWVYGIAIGIIGAIFTPQDFLEKVFALITSKKEE